MSCSSCTSSCPNCQGWSAKERAQYQLEQLRCGGHGCIFGHAGGMGTNSGCHIDKMNQRELRDYLRKVGAILVDVIEDKED